MLPLVVRWDMPQVPATDRCRTGGRGWSCGSLAGDAGRFLVWRLRFRHARRLTIFPGSRPGLMNPAEKPDPYRPGPGSLQGRVQGGLAMERRWLTGQEAMDAHDLRPIELFKLIENGLPAYHPDTLRRYYPMVTVLSGDGERMEWRQWEGLIPPQKERFVFTGPKADLWRAMDQGRTPTPEELANAEPYTGQLDQILGAVFRPEDVDHAISDGRTAPTDDPTAPGASERPRKTPEELLQLHERGMSIKDLAKNFYSGTGDPTNANTTRGWVKDQISKAKKARAKNGAKNPK